MTRPSAILRRPELSEGPALSAAKGSRRLPPDSRRLMAHLHRSSRAQQGLHPPALVGVRGYEDSNLVVAEAGIVGDAPLSHENRKEGHRRDSTQSSEKNGELEGDHHVGRNRS